MSYGGNERNNYIFFYQKYFEFYIWNVYFGRCNKIVEYQYIYIYIETKTIYEIVLSKYIIFES